MASTEDHASEETPKSPTTSRLLTHLGTYPIISKPYHLVDTYTPFHLPSKIIDALPAVPASLDAAADQYLTQFDSALETTITSPVTKGYNAVIVKPREVVRTATEAYVTKGMEVVAGSMRVIEDKVESVGEYFLPDTTEAKEQKKNEEEAKTNGVKPITYKDALVTDGLPYPGENDIGGEGARWTEGGSATNVSASYKTALIEGTSGPQDTGADELGGAGAEWPVQDHPSPPANENDAAEKKAAEPKSKTEATKSKPSSNDRQKPTNPHTELINLTTILQIYATRAYERNKDKSGPQLVHDTFGLTKTEFIKVKELVDQSWKVERGYVAKMLEAGKSVERQGKEEEGRRMSAGSGGVVGMAKGAVGYGVGVVSGGVGVVKGVVGLK